MIDRVICDRNKSVLTHRVTSAAASWMDEAGFKPVETEVPICAGWVADLAGVLCPTKTEATALKLIPRRGPYSRPNAWREWCDAFAALPPIIIGLVEVKTSRSDFAGDHKWVKPCPANLCWLAMPTKGFCVDELPEAWGVLQFSEGGTIRMSRPAKLAPVSVESQLQIVLAIATRRDHSTRYEHLKKIRAMETARHNEEVNRSRLADVIRAVASVVRMQHGSVEEALRYHGIRKVPEYLQRELADLWGIAVETAGAERVRPDAESTMARKF